MSLTFPTWQRSPILTLTSLSKQSNAQAWHYKLLSVVGLSEQVFLLYLPVHPRSMEKRVITLKVLWELSPLQGVVRDLCVRVSVSQLSSLQACTQKLWKSETRRHTDVYSRFAAYTHPHVHTGLSWRAVCAVRNFGQFVSSLYAEPCRRGTLVYQRTLAGLGAQTTQECWCWSG